MIQFTESEVQLFREKIKKDDSVIVWLKNAAKYVIEHEIKIPHTGIATWGHYYECPYDSVQLIFNIENNIEHVCPLCNRIFSGEPYDGAWWRLINGISADGCYYLSLLWLFTEEEKYFELAKYILLEFSKYYPDYEEHGGIPNNEPGKANAQTLCDSMWIRSLVSGYDILKDHLNEDDVELIENQLLLPCAEFLIKHRSSQIHNHEVIINGAIAILGILLKRKDYINFALYEKYGLKYQLENAVLSDNFWFEGSFHYHFFGLDAFFKFEKFAKNTDYGFVKLDYYRNMLKFPLKLLHPDASLPPINDCTHAYGRMKYFNLYELAYSMYGDKEFAYILRKGYGDDKRSNLDSFLFGVETLPFVEEPILEDYHNAKGSGITVIRGSSEKYFLFKHAPFGGEHDHYDRLGFYFNGFGNEIVPDLATTQYGAPLHYDYYKNTGSHNTVVINEENHSPADTVVLNYKKDEDYTLIDAQTKWDGSYIHLDSHSRIEWDEKSYEGVSMRRVFYCFDEYFIELFIVEGVKNKTIDWVIHVKGDLQQNHKLLPLEGRFSEKKPFKYLKDVKSIKYGDGSLKSCWEMPKCELNVYSMCTKDNTVYYGKAPANPSNRDISYMINRIEGEKTIFSNVFEACKKGNSKITNVNFKVLSDKVEITVIEKDKAKTVSILI